MIKTVPSSPTIPLALSIPATPARPQSSPHPRAHCGMEMKCLPKRLVLKIWYPKGSILRSDWVTGVLNFTYGSVHPYLVHINELAAGRSGRRKEGVRVWLSLLFSFSLFPGSLDFCGFPPPCPSAILFPCHHNSTGNGTSPHGLKSLYP